MTRLTDALRSLADAGAPRGADDVLAAARTRAARLRRRRLVAMGGVAVAALVLAGTAGVMAMSDDTTTIDSGLAATPSTGVGPSPTAGPADPSPPLPPSTATTPEVAPQPTVAPGEGTVVEVFFLAGTEDGCSRVQAVERRVEGPAVLRGALDELLGGPTEAEQAAGLSSTFSAVTTGGVRSVDIVEGVALVDLRGELAAAMPSASTSCGSAALLAQLDATVTQFDGVKRVVYSYDGDVAAFYGSWDGVAPDGSSNTPEADGIPAWAGTVGLDPSGSLDLRDFPEHLEREVHPRGPITDGALASLLLHLEDERARGTLVQVEDEPGDGIRTVTVTLTHLADDSVAEVRYELRFDTRPGSPSTISGSWAQRCHPGRGHQDLRPELCA